MTDRRSLGRAKALGRDDKGEASVAVRKTLQWLCTEENGQCVARRMPMVEGHHVSWIELVKSA